MTPRDILHQSLQAFVAPMLSQHGYKLLPSGNTFARKTIDMKITIRFQGNRSNRGGHATFTSCWSVHSSRYKVWLRQSGISTPYPGHLFTANDWLIPGWPIDSTGFSATEESDYDKPNITAFASAAANVAVPLFEALATAEGAASWAIGNLSLVDSSMLRAFLNAEHAEA